LGAPASPQRLARVIAGELVGLVDRLAALARELIPPDRPAVRAGARPLPP